ncbi:MAG: pseudaminic acid synthase [gamma proteobacterium symbiont of Taylorina sp.]|nr:pseudaminic acid synthase [gamma proteobacterium symbiont of Taylorina sp.]
MTGKQIINIAGTEIGEHRKPFIVAELSGNHQQDFSLAEKMIEKAAGAGADAVKLQTYTPDTMTFNLQNDDFVIAETDSLWHGQNLYDLYAKAATPWEWHESLFQKARSLGMIAFSSPFDESAVDFLESLNVPCYKIASFENNDIPLIKKVAMTGKPVIVSTGMASLSEIDALLGTIYETGNDQVILLKCTSNYPADASDSNLATIVHMKQTFDCPVGLSDHSTGIGVSLAGVALGACLIEKHFVLDRSKGGVDSDFSIEPEELKLLVSETKKIPPAIGRICYGGTKNEQQSKNYRRSIYASEDISKGELFNQHNIRIIRPGFGLQPKYYEDVVGRKASKAIAKGTPLDWNLIE